jgi:hypothetical protein
MHDVVQNENDDVAEIAAGLLDGLRHELEGWDVEPKLLREAFMRAVAELRDEDFGEQQDAGEEV